MRVWAKNQLRFEIFEKILKFTCKKLNGKLLFYPFFSYFPGLFHFIHLCNIPKKFFLRGGGLYKSLRMASAERRHCKGNFIDLIDSKWVRFSKYNYCEIYFRYWCSDYLLLFNDLLDIDCNPALCTSLIKYKHSLFRNALIAGCLLDCPHENYVIDIHRSLV